MKKYLNYRHFLYFHSCHGFILKKFFQVLFLLCCFKMTRHLHLVSTIRNTHLLMTEARPSCRCATELTFLQCHSEIKLFVNAFLKIDFQNFIQTNLLRYFSSMWRTSDSGSGRFLCLRGCQWILGKNFRS